MFLIYLSITGLFFIFELFFKLYEILPKIENLPPYSLLCTLNKIDKKYVDWAGISKTSGIKIPRRSKVKIRRTVDVDVGGIQPGLLNCDEMHVMRAMMGFTLLMNALLLSHSKLINRVLHR